MWRGFVVAVTVVLGLCPAIHAQYPYAPAPYGPMPGYSYPPAMMQQMPAYPPNPLMSRPVYYYQAPTPRAVYYYQAPMPRPAIVTGQPIDVPNGPAELPANTAPPTVTSSPPERVANSQANGVVRPRATLIHFQPRDASQPDDALPTQMDISRDLGATGDAARGGIFAGVGIYLIQPRFQSNPAFQITTANPGAPLVGSQREFSYNTSVSPQAFIGYKNDSGLGIRMSWWRFDQKAQEAATVGLNSIITPANPLGLGGALATAPGDVIVANSRLRLDAYDVEITQRWQPCRAWSVELGAGVRYAQIFHSYGFSADTPGFGSTGSVNFTSAFSGVGPALSLEAHRSLCTGFGLYTTGRGSVLFGTVRQHADLSNLGAAGVFGPVASNDSSRSVTMPTIELEIGAEYRHTVGRAEWFLQSGFVGHTWFGAGNSTGTDSTFTGNTNSNVNLGFIGLAVRAGVKF